MAQTALLSTQGPDKTVARAMYQSPQTEYQLQSGQNQLNVVLTWKNPQGLKIQKIYQFHRGEYVIHISYMIDNQSQQVMAGDIGESAHTQGFE